LTEYQIHVIENGKIIRYLYGMKRLLNLIAGSLPLISSSQSFPVKNVNNNYFVSSIYQSNISRNNFHDFLRDNKGLYWFQNTTEVYSFDGVNWKSYELRSQNRSMPPFRINAMEAGDDGNIWLGTEYGMFVYDLQKECFVMAGEKFPELTKLPQAITCFEPAPKGILVFLSFFSEGFYILNLKSKKCVQVIIDPERKTYIPTNGWPVTIDKAGNLWGTTIDYRGVWNYNFSSGKIRCSWKGELPQFADKRFTSFASYTYAESENALWISHSANRYVERMDMLTGKSSFFSFTENLKVHADTNAANRYDVAPIKIDKENNAWVRAGGKYIVRLNKDVKRMEYLCNDRDELPIGEFEIFKPESAMTNEQNNILLWVQGVEKLSMIKERENLMHHIYFDTSVTGVKREYFTNNDSRQHIYLQKGRNGGYFLLQQNPLRPKLICLDQSFRVKKVLLNEWSQYPAVFKMNFDPDTFYIAIMRPQTEPVDFRHVVLKDFRIDLNTLHVEEAQLSFRQRVYRYGSSDYHNVFWLFSNGFLYSYDPAKDILDSIYICKPTEKKPNAITMVKGYNYPTLLHKNSSTFWISFFPARQLYKINLETRKIEKIFQTCIDRNSCGIPGAVYDLYAYDSNRIYLKQSLSGSLLNVHDDSITDLSQIFQREMPVGNPGGVSMARDWACFSFPSDIFLLNTTTGKQKHLVIEEDFKWNLSVLRSGPLFNDRGEIVFMSADKGFLIFNIDSTPFRKKPGLVHYAFVKVDNKYLPQDSLVKNKGLFLKYNHYNMIQLAFSDYSVFASGKVSYEYSLYKKGDTIWNKILGKPELTISDLSPGRYQLLLRAVNTFGDHSPEIRSLPVVILPLWWQTWWFKVLIIAALGMFFYGLYRYRMQQLLRLQVVRNNIASDLHDDIGSTLNSISIYSEVAKQQAGKDIPALELIGMNSRKIVENMSDIVWTINPENDSFEKIIVRMRSFAYQLLKAKQVEYSFEVDEKLNPLSLPMQVRKNFYLVFKEAITNLVKYSCASRVFISLYEENKAIILKIRDNGKGIPENFETLGNGLLNMKRRAEEIRAGLMIQSANGEGTSIEMMLKI